MKSKELFMKVFSLWEDFRKAEVKLDELKITIDESVFVNSFYGLFDEIIPLILTPEGSEILYENILFLDLEKDEILERLDGYFI